MTRGQAVLLAAAVAAVALLPLVAAYLQAGAVHQPTAPAVDGVADADRTLDRAVARSARRLPATYDWSERRRAAAAVRERVTAVLGAVERRSPAVVAAASLDESAAARAATRRCPSGPDRQFGDCVAVGGVVVQERADRTHLVAVAVSLRVTATDGGGAVTLVVTADDP